MKLFSRSAGVVRSLLVPLFVSACSLDDGVSPLEPETGTGQVYSLVTLNEKTVPVTLTQGNASFLVEKGALTLAPDSTFILSLVISQTGNGTSQRTITTQRGDYTVPAQPSTAITLMASGDSVAVFSGTYSTTAVAITDLTVAQGDRMRFTRP